MSSFGRNGFTMEDGEISDGGGAAAAQPGNGGLDRSPAAGTNGSTGGKDGARRKDEVSMDVEGGRVGAVRGAEATAKTGRREEIDISPPASPFRKDRKEGKREEKRKKDKKKSKKKEKKREKKEKRKSSKRSRSPESMDRHEKTKKKHKGDRRDESAVTRKKDRRSRSESAESSASSPRARHTDHSRRRDYGEERRGRRSPSPRRERSRDKTERRRSRERAKDHRSRDRRSSRSPVDRYRDKRRSRSQNRYNRRKYGDTRDAGRDDSQRDRDRRRDRRGGRRGSRSRSRSRSRQKTKEEIEKEEQNKIEEAKYQAEVAKQLDDLEEEVPFSDSENEDGAIEEEKSEEQLAAERRAKREAIMAAAKAKKKQEPRFAGEQKAPGAGQENSVSRVKENEKVHEEPDPEDQDFDLFTDDIDKLKAQKDSTIKAIDLASFTDTDGYYTFRLGDLLNDRYRVTKRQGKGVFSTVLRCADLKDNNKVIIVKVIRSNETMYRAGQKELEFLKLMAENDPDNKKHCVKLLSHFEHRNHLCMCFEPMHMNLRELLRKLGGIGLSVAAVRAFAKQLFVGLKHLRACKIVHADIKPDNILVNEQLNYVKICDLGSASSVKDCEITPYLVSRFYRAPEIMAGLRYDEKIDIWSIATVLYELYTGKILFVGKDNNEMLKMQFDISGVFPKRLIQKAEFKEKHFGDDLVFRFYKIDKFSKAELQIPMKFQENAASSKKKLHQKLLHHSMKLNSAGRQKVAQLADLLQKMFAIDPKQRYDVDQCLKHPFVKD